jgi:PKD repeat protein
MRTGAALLAAGFLSLPAALTPGASSAAEAIPSFIHGTATTSPATATLTSSSPLVLDTFTRANQTGWGTGSGGGTWSTGSALSVASNEGTISYSGTSQYLTLGSTTAADGVGLVRFSIQASNDTAGIILRDQSNGNMDVARYDGAGDIAFMYRISGSWTTVAKVAFPITLKQFYWLRFEVQGSNVMFKAWPAGTSEPSAWTWSGTSTAINAAGEMGLYGYAASGAPVEFDSFSVVAPTPPTAALTVSPSSGAAPLAVTANASGSAPGSSPISTYAFNFGDGTSVVGPQSGATANHTYAASGTFTVTATVTDSSGASSTATQTVVVGGTPPTAALTVSPSSGAAPLAVTANASGSTPGSNPISTYTFNFGDGTVVGPQPGATANHTYTAGGTFTVTVTVTDSVGATATTTQGVTVGAPMAALSVSPLSGQPPLAVTANASASTDPIGISNYTFNFGDGTIIGPQSGSTTTHTYTSTGTYTAAVTVTDSTGASSTATQVVVVSTPPTAALSLNSSSGQAPLPVTANASGSTPGSSPISTYTFNFGDGTVIGPQPGATASHTYTAGGTFTVTVTVTDSVGATATATHGVTVGAPRAALSVSPLSGQPPLAVTANASASTDPIGISVYTFNFGDGTLVGPQPGSTAAHTYTGSGTYTVMVTVTDSTGASSTASQVVVVSTPPTAALSLNWSSGQVPLAVIANASGSTPGSNPINTYTFNFGDGTIVGPQPGAAANHTYTAGGTFTVTVTVTDSAGASSTATRGVTVGAPVAALSVSPSAGAAPVLVTANASASSDPIGISGYTFNFGDGTVVGPQPGATASHSFTAAGIYTVSLTVTDSTGASSTAIQAVTVGAPVAALSVSPTSGAAPLLVTANASASTDPIGISGYTFSFGDGTVVGPQLSATATHTYTAGGTYTVTVTVTDSSGATATTAQGVTVGAPVAALSVSPSAGEAPVLVTASASASTDPIGISGYTFNFGDGTIVGPQSGATTSHTFAAAGIYTVSLTVTDSSGSSSTALQAVTVGAPVAALSVSPTSGVAPLLVTANASASADPIGISGYTFTFGDGTVVGPQLSATATHTFTAGGVYAVTVTVTDSSGATATATEGVTVGGPVAELSLSASSGGAPLPVTADASASTDPLGISTYTFNFGDGTVVGPQSQATATHTFTAGGSYTVSVTVSDIAGASATAIQAVTIGSPEAVLSLSTQSGQPPLAVTANAAASTDPIGISSYTFNFGDGTLVGPQAAPTATHTYASAGTFVMTVTVADGVNQTSTASATVSAITPPAASLSVTPGSGLAPLAVLASGAGSQPGSRPIASYTFNFGDGTVLGPQSTPIASHTYTTIGTYTVTLTVQDSGGVGSSATSSVSTSSSTLAADTFTRANQTGWGTASGGGTWSTGSALSVASNEGTISYSGTSQYLTLGSTTAADGVGLVRFSIQASNDTAGIILRDQSNGNMDVARYDGAGNIAFMYRISGTWTTVAKVAFPITLKQFYWLRFEVQGSNVMFKAWPAGSTEPSAWTWSGTSTAISAAGEMGLYGYAASGAPVEFDSFSVTAPSTSPPPPANATITGSVSDSITSAPLAGIQVSTLPATTTTTTNNQGAYTLPVPAGTYTVVFTGTSSGYNENVVTSVLAPAGGSVTANQALVAVPPQVGMDTFTEPNQTGGWSPSTDGQAWTSDIASPPNSGHPINGAGITSEQAWVDTSGSTFQDFDTWMGYPYANQQVTADVDITSVLPDASFQHGPRLLARVQGSSTSWNAVVMTIDPPDGSNPIPPGSTQACTGGDVSLWVTLPSSTWTELAMVCQTISIGTTYHAELSVVGTLVEGNVWTGSTAPTGWEISANQTLLQGAGEAGTRTTGSYVDYANFAQTPVTQISGAVTDSSSGAPITGASVTINNTQPTPTNAAGAYDFSGLTGGTSYTISASAPGYSPSSVAVTPATGITTIGNLALTSLTTISTAGGLSVSAQVQSAITNNPNGNQLETDLTWTDPTTDNGWRVGTIPGYGGANLATWYEVDSGVVGAQESALNTSNPGDLAHDFTQLPNGSYVGSESTPYQQAVLAPSLTPFRAGYQATVPSGGVDANGFVQTVTTYVYPGDPGFMVDRFQITNPGSAPITLASTDSIEFDVISGLEVPSNTWAAADGGYGNVGGTPVQGWPTAAVPGDPDYFYVLPTSGSGTQDGMMAVLATKLTSLGLSNPEILSETNLHRLKVKVYGSKGSFPANTTISFYMLQAIDRNLSAQEAAAIAADFLNPDTPSMTTGVFQGFNLAQGLYQFAAADNQVTFTPTFSAAVQERWLAIYEVNGYTADQLPTVTLGGVPLRPGIDFVATVDTATDVAYVKLMEPLVPGSPGTGQLESGQITISG